MKIGDLVAYKDSKGSLGVLLEKQYDTNPPVRGIKFYVIWSPGVCMAQWGNGWYGKEHLELVSEGR